MVDKKEQKEQNFKRVETKATIKIETEDTESGFMVINKKDFDPKKHKEFKGKPPKEKPPKMIKIVAKNEAGFEEIKESDFNKDVHEKFKKK